MLGDHLTNCRLFHVTKQVNFTSYRWFHVTKQVTDTSYRWFHVREQVHYTSFWWFHVREQVHCTVGDFMLGVPSTNCRDFMWGVHLINCWGFHVRDQIHFTTCRWLQWREQAHCTVLWVVHFANCSILHRVSVISCEGASPLYLFLVMSCERACTLYRCWKFNVKNKSITNCRWFHVREQVHFKMRDTF
jgi:hypothetical protein